MRQINRTRNTGIKHKQRTVIMNKQQQTHIPYLKIYFITKYYTVCSTLYNLAEIPSSDGVTCSAASARVFIFNTNHVSLGLNARTPT